MNQICIFCGSGRIGTKSVRGGKINICKNCGLGFNDILSNVNYEEETHFNVDEKQLEQWKIFTDRDYALIEKIILDNNHKNILEIGSGYGLLSKKIKESSQIDNVYSFELNLSMQKFMSENGLNVVSNIEDVKSKKIDLIIMNHVLEHIENAHEYIVDILNKFPNATLILFQTNHIGFIPKYLPHLWYGWQLNQHYFHFTPMVFDNFAKMNNLNFKLFTFYKLDQLVSFSLKGIVKLPLYILNKFFINDTLNDAFVCLLSKKEL
jgi:hypothetical protein